SAAAATAADAITYWAARYTIHDSCTLVTDGGSHFAAQLLQTLLVNLRIRHHVVVAYSPWANGSAEVENRTIIRLVRSLCSEFRLDYNHWHLILPTLMYLINNTPVTATKMSPNQIYMVTAKAPTILPIQH